MFYSQISRKFQKYTPYFRYQYVNVPSADPVNGALGRYNGPSGGLRLDLSDYAALKIQYNRLFQRALPAQNGLVGQVSFTF